MRMTKITMLAALTAGAMLALSPALSAAEKEGKQPEGRPGGPRGGPAMGARLAEELKLTDEQKTKVQDLMKGQAGKRRALRDDSALSDEQRREKVKAMMEDTNKKMKDILTAEQYEKWTKLREQGRGAGGPGGRKGGPPGEKRGQGEKN